MLLQLGQEVDRDVLVASFKFRFRKKYPLLCLGVFFCIFVFSTYQKILPLRNSHPQTTKVMEKRKQALPTQELKQTWISLETIPSHLIESVLFVEDQDFYSHHGISFRKIRCAYLANKHSDTISHGGSTITQQIAKNMFLHSKRTYGRKIHEAWIALLMETCLSKKRLLEIYLNIAEWGPGIFGIEEGTKYWFGKSAEELTGKESVQLAMILSNPLERDPKNPSNYLEGLSNHLLTILAGKELISHEELLQSLYLPPKIAQKVEHLTLETQHLQ